MKHLAKSWLLWTMLILIGIIAAIIIVLKTINFNAYKPDIEKAFQENTGLSLDIQGNIHWGAPWRFEIEIENIVIKDPQQPSSKPPLAAIAKIDAVFQLKSLVKRNFIPHEVKVNGAVISITKGQRWNFIPASSRATTGHSTSTFESLGIFSHFAIIVENSKIIFGAGSKAAQTLTLNQAVMTLDLLEREIKLTGIAHYDVQPFDVLAQLNYSDAEFNPPYQVKIDITTENNALSFNGTMGRSNKSEQGEIQAEGEDLAKLLRIFGISGSTMGPYQVQSQVALSQNGIVLGGLSGQVFDGSLSGNLGINWSNLNRITYDIDIMAHNINAVAFLKGFEVSQQLRSGRANMQYNMTSFGDSASAILAHQTGSLFLGLVEGQYKSRGLAIYTQKLFHLLSGGISNDTTTLNCVLLQLQCQNGNCGTQALAIDTPGADVVGRGNINFNQSTIDLLLIPTSKNVNLNPLALPMSVKGNLDNPTVLPAGGQLTLELTNTLLNVVTGRAFNQLTRGSSGQDAQTLAACANTLQNYQQKQSHSVTSQVKQSVKRTTDQLVDKLENL